MSSFFAQAPRVIVQGITGREARFWTERMIACGTQIVAGVTPGKGGQHVDAIPVYDHVEEAVAQHAATTSVLFVPPRAAKSAVFEAVAAGVETIILLTEHVPLHDTMELLAEADERDVSILGPNSPGMAVPGSYFLGILPAWEPTIFSPGPIGVASRSGSLGTLVCVELVRRGLGQSAFLGIGGDPILGTTFYDTLNAFEADPGTEAVVLLGEIGGTMEEDAATFIAEMSKPVVAFIGGVSAPEGRRMGHAGAIVAGNKGTAQSKIAALREAGAHVAVSRGTSRGRAVVITGSGVRYFALADPEELTVFADYIVPVALLRLGIISYSAELEDAINARQVIPRDSEEEVEIRAATIWACHLLTHAINERRPPTAK